MKRTVRFKFLKIGRKIKQSVFLNKNFPDFKNPIYWKGDRKSFAKAGFIGCFFMMLPVPFQMLLSSVAAYYLKGNIPLATALAWITNPLTMIPIWWSGYNFGTWLLGTSSLDSITQGFQPFSYEWFSLVFPSLWVPLYLGNLLIGIFFGVILFMSINYWANIKNLFNKKSNNKGFSLQSVIVGSIIAAILAVVGTISLMGTVSDSRALTVASHITSQVESLKTHTLDNFKRLEAANLAVNGGDANLDDYLNDAIKAGYLERTPDSLFQDKAALTWEIRKVVVNGKKAYYIYITSTNSEDQTLIDEALNKTSFFPERVLKTP